MTQLPTEDGVYLFVGKSSLSCCDRGPNAGPTSLNLWIVRGGKVWSPLMLEKHNLVGVFVRLDDAQIQAAVAEAEQVCAQAYADYLDSKDWYEARRLTDEIEPASYAELVATMRKQ